MLPCFDLVGSPSNSGQRGRLSLCCAERARQPGIARWHPMQIRQRLGSPEAMHASCVACCRSRASSSDLAICYGAAHVTKLKFVLLDEKAGGGLRPSKALRPARAHLVQHCAGHQAHSAGTIIPASPHNSFHIGRPMCGGGMWPRVHYGTAALLPCTQGRGHGRLSVAP